MLVDRELDGARELFANDRPHAAAEIIELEDAQHGRQPADAGDAGDNGLFERRLLARGLHTIAIPLGVFEVERITGREPRLPLLEAAGVDQQADALTRADAERIATLGTDASTALDLRA